MLTAGKVDEILSRLDEMAGSHYRQSFCDAKHLRARHIAIFNAIKQIEELINEKIQENKLWALLK